MDSLLRPSTGWRVLTPSVGKNELWVHGKHG
jgi:hypothetical protein